jgi:hypothetical protein
MPFLAVAVAAVVAASGCAPATAPHPRVATFPGGDPAHVLQYSTDPYAGGDAPPFWGGPED